MGVFALAFGHHHDLAWASSGVRPSGVWSTLVSIPAFLLAVEAFGNLLGPSLPCEPVYPVNPPFCRRETSGGDKPFGCGGFVYFALSGFNRPCCGYSSPLGRGLGAGSVRSLHSQYILITTRRFFCQRYAAICEAAYRVSLGVDHTFPFTRLVHALSVPLHYFVRSPQKVVWNSSRSQVRFEQEIQLDNEKRLFLKAAFGAGASVALLSLGVLDKFFRYFLKQDLTNAEESHILSQKLQRLKQSAAERELELERMNKDSIFVAKLSELSRTRGKYFIDYQMRPALAFSDEQGLPILISAKCTHLGCTVGQDLDGQGRILCPCHISYFDIKDRAAESRFTGKITIASFRLGFKR